MKSSQEPSTNSKWINSSILQYRSSTQNKKIYLQHPIQPGENDEYQMEGLDDGPYNQSTKIKELKDQLNTPRNNEKLLNNHIQYPKIHQQPKMDLMTTKSIPCIQLIDQYQLQQVSVNNMFNSNSISYQILTIISFSMNSVAIIVIPAQSYSDDKNYAFHYTYIFFILLQILLNLTLQDNSVGITRESLPTVIQNYLKSNLLLDLSLFILIILETTLQENNMRIFVLLIIALIIQINRCKQLHRIKIYYNLYNKLAIFLTHSLNYVIILNLLGFFLFYFVKEMDYFQSNNHNEQYLLSIYSVIQMNSHIIPESKSQAIGIIIVNVIYIFLNAYILIEFFQLRKMDESLCQLYQYLYENQPDLSIKLKIMKELDKTNSLQFYKKYIEKLNETSVKERILQQYFSNLSQKTINTLAFKSSIELFEQNQVIIQQDQIDDCSIYFVLEGNVTVYSRNCTELQRLNSSCYFGELSFYTNQLRTATVKSPIYCKLLKLSRKDFLQETTFLEKQPFFQNSDQILQKLKMPNNCFCCKSQEHYIQSCPSLIYHPEHQIKQKKIQDREMSLIQKRNTFCNNKYHDVVRRQRQSKKRIPYTDLKKIVPEVYEQMMREQLKNCEISSSSSSEEDISIEHETFKFSNNTSSDKLSNAANKGESCRMYLYVYTRIGTDYGFPQQSKYLKTILEKEEEIESPSFNQEENNQNFVTKSQDGVQNNNILYEKINVRQKSKSFQFIDIKNNLNSKWPVQNYQKDFENIQEDFESFENKKINNQFEGFEKMQILVAYFPHHNYHNQIKQANQVVKSKQNQYHQ